VLANIGIHVQDRRNSRNAMEKQLTDKKILIKDPAGNIVEWEIQGTHLKESFFQKSVPFLSTTVAAIICFLNICPGLGTLLGSFAILFGSSSSFESKSKGFWIGVLTAVLQMITALLLIGWFWSIMHGVHFIQKAKECSKQPGKKENNN